jgi:hypothetical protein
MQTFRTNIQWREFCFPFTYFYDSHFGAVNHRKLKGNQKLELYTEFQKSDLSTAEVSSEL